MMQFGDIFKYGLLTKRDLPPNAGNAALTAHTGDTSNPHGTTKAQVGLGNADNTSDVNKPVSTAQQTALNEKSDITALTAHTGDTSNPHSVTKTQVGLGNADNTSDANKPVSTAQQTALNEKSDITALTAHTGDTSNPHGVTKAQVGLGNADNTSDVNKPVSAAQQTALNGKVDLNSAQTIPGNKKFTGDTVVGVQTDATDGALSIAAKVLNACSPTKMTTNLAALPEVVGRFFRAGTMSIKYNASFDFMLGTYANGLAALSKLTIRLGNGNTHTPEVDVITLQGNGNIGVGTIDPTSNLDLLGSYAGSLITTASSSYTVPKVDQTIRVTALIGQTIVLPAALTYPRRILRIVNPTNAFKTISSYTSMLGFANTTIYQRSTLILQSDGANWVEISNENNRMVLTNTRQTGAIGGVTFSITLGDPLALNTSVAATGYIKAEVTQYANGLAHDYWVGGTSGVIGMIIRGGSLTGTTRSIGIFNAAYSSNALGHITTNGITYRITSSTAGAAQATVVIEAIN